MGIAPLPEEPLGPENTDEAWVSPLANKQPRESEGYEAFEEDFDGDDGPYGSLVILRPKAFKKKPVLTVDPEELEKAYEAFEVCGAQIMEAGDTPVARHGAQFLGLAPIEEGEEAIESDDNVVADDDLDALLQNALHSEELAEEAWEEPASDLEQEPVAPQPQSPPDLPGSHGSVESEEPQVPVESVREESSSPSSGISAAAPQDEPQPEHASEPARPSFSLPELHSDDEKEEASDMHRGDGWSLAPPDEPASETAHEPMDEPANETAEAPTETSDASESSDGRSYYYEDEEETFDPFAAAEPRKLAHVQEAGTRSQLRAKLLRQEEQHVEPEARKAKFSLFGWLRRLFG